jgi:hypothetical protein
MAGILHIFRLDESRTAPEPTLRHYQANYTTPGNTYARAYDEAELALFLRTKAALSEAQLERALEELHGTGRTTIGDVDIPESEAAALGLEQQPSDS